MTSSANISISGGYDLCSTSLWFRKLQWHHLQTFPSLQSMYDLCSTSLWSTGSSSTSWRRLYLFLSQFMESKTRKQNFNALRSSCLLNFQRHPEHYKLEIWTRKENSHPWLTLAAFLQFWFPDLFLDTGLDNRIFISHEKEKMIK